MNDLKTDVRAQQNEAVEQFARIVITEIEKSYDQSFCAADAIDIIKEELLKSYGRNIV